MNRRFLVLSTMLLFFSTSTLFGQTSFASNDSNNLIENTTELLNLNDENWSFYTDEESNTIFIDFETIKANLSDIVIVNETNEILFKEDVLDLPVNTIYELDLNQFKKGAYTLELRSFTKTIKKNISID